MRLPPSTDAQPVRSGLVPKDLRQPDFQRLLLNREEADAFERTLYSMSADLRFEYMTEDEASDALWRFASMAFLRQKGVVKRFMTEHAKEPLTKTVYFPVELLKVKEPIEMCGAEVLPIARDNVPPLMGQPPVESFDAAIAVQGSGTGSKQLIQRTRAVAEHVLRVMRFALHEHSVESQLRFRLGEMYWFDDRRSGWQRSPERGFEAGVDATILDKAGVIGRMPATAENDVERQAHLALEWFERAQLATDGVIKVMFAFFALEAVLGTEKDNEIARPLAVRRAMLDVVLTETFVDPGRMYFYYDRVRSAAVHGERVAAIDASEVIKFAWDTRRAVTQFVEFARSQGFTKRRQVRTALDTHESR